MLLLLVAVFSHEVGVFLLLLPHLKGTAGCQHQEWQGFSARSGMGLVPGTGDNTVLALGMVGHHHWERHSFSARDRGALASGIAQ